MSSKHRPSRDVAQPGRYAHLNTREAQDALRASLAKRGPKTTAAARAAWDRAIRIATGEDRT